MKRLWLYLALGLAGCTDGSTAGPVLAAPPPAQEAEPPPPAALPSEPTRILDRAEANRLLAASGVTLQWIDWNTRGSVFAREEGGVIRLTAAQASPDGPGRLFLDGEVREVGQGYFEFDGVIRITDTPDAGRSCEADKLWHFAVTQNRPYWRLREFEWCDDLTDYVDIYFPGTRP